MPPLTYEAVKASIVKNLSPDLLDAKWRALVNPSAPVETGHCAVATEAFYHLAGGKDAGFIPVVCSYRVTASGRMVFGSDEGDPRTHWWTRAPGADGKRGTGAVVDITAKQYSSPFPYEKGRNTGFMQPQKIPSKRARILMDRVEKELGKATLDAFRAENIRAFQTPARHTRLKKVISLQP